MKTLSSRTEIREDWLASGICTVCGRKTSFRHQGSGSIREGYTCPGCGASLRYRHQALVLLRLYSRNGAPSLAELVREDGFRRLAIYEPGLIGPFRKLFRKLPSYTTSYYWPDVRSGDTRDGVRREDLEALTFADETFDLVITSDIFEHVRRPLDAFAEINRVLKPGGRHVFTVPLAWPLPERSFARVDTTGSDDLFLAPPVYHGSPTDTSGSLVYTEFGLDLVDRLDAIGMRTRLHPGIRYCATFCAEPR